MTAGAPPLVSVTIPVYNGERFLARALESVLGQDYAALDVTVVDDGSTDGSAAIAARYPVRCLRRDNGGVAAARNTGIQVARGDLLAFLDQDDVWLPGKLSLQVAHLIERPQLGFVLARQRIVLEPGTARPAWLSAEMLAQDHVGYFPGTLLARRRVFAEVGLFHVAAPPAEGADWFARARDAGVAMAVLPHVLLEKHVHQDNQGHDVARVRAGVLRALHASVRRKRQAP
jgi:glycosyltransferase involved in cell wall biosynthesis